jgi:hypothetical protein
LKSLGPATTTPFSVTIALEMRPILPGPFTIRSV